MNAIILAAGVGHRFGDLTLRNNKALLSVGGITIIERMIKFLKEAGIDDILVVTGHMHELFLPLKEMYGITLLHNKKYSVYNNLHSLEMVLDHLSDTYLIHGDVVLFKNIFKKEDKQNFFYTVLKNPKGVPSKHLLTDKSRKITGVTICSANEAVTTLLGVSYWNAEGAAQIKDYYKTSVTPKMKRKYRGEWEDEILKLITDVRIEAHQIDSKYAHEMNHINDYLDVCTTYETYWKPKQ